MYDITKFQKLAEYKDEPSINNVKFWEQQRAFLSSTINGELILNGFGSKAVHQKFPVLIGEPINDFKIRSEWEVLVCGNECQVFEIDIRKGVTEVSKQ